MIGTSADSNLFVYAADPDSPSHETARLFFNGHRSDSADAEFVLSELVLIELYMQLRNPAVFKKPYSALEAASYCGALKKNPRWRCVDYEPEVSASIWRWAKESSTGFRHIIDARLGLTLRHHGITDFATSNVKDFKRFGFSRVWNPVAA
jgi:uncharacterized protein